MDAFRINNKEEESSLPKQLIVGALILAIVVSFIWQISLGLCPVP
ncbi:MAG: hypothetical protein U5J95_08235 [Balneolaceae bacterium]|nr:hypothetical protein [Balneolaceae bacterium]